MDNRILNLATIFLAIATIALAAITFLLKRATELQFVASLTIAFQDEWHKERATLMRDYLHSKDFQVVLNEAIEKAYGKVIKYTQIDRLLDRTELVDNRGDDKRLKAFEDHLRNSLYPKDAKPNKTRFNAYEAIYNVLLSFDRLAVVQDVPLMMKKCILKYKPPIRDLSPVLQAFIAVRILLKEPDQKNYKKDYMFLLARMKLHDRRLLEKCKEGLIERGELNDKELKEIERIQQADS